MKERKNLSILGGAMNSMKTRTSTIANQSRMPAIQVMSAILAIPDISIIVPCYNESKNIPLILSRFSKTIKHAMQKGRNAERIDTELILVNNGSTDDSAHVLKLELKKYRFARTVLVPVNQGYGYGVLQGLRASKGKILAYTHADMQCDPEDVLRAYDVYQNYPKNNQAFNGKLLVKGKRRKRKLFDAVFSTCFGVIASLVFFRRLSDINGQPKLFPRELLLFLEPAPKDFSFDLFVMAAGLKKNYRIISIPVDFEKRAHGTSKWAFSLKSKLRTIFGFFISIFKIRWQLLTKP